MQTKISTIYKGVRAWELSPPRPFPFPQGFWDSGESGDTDVSSAKKCAVGRGGSMIRRRERRRTHHQNQREEVLGPEKRNEIRADDSVRIGNTFDCHYYIILYYWLLLFISRHQMDPSTTFVRDDRFRIVLNKARDPRGRSHTATRQFSTRKFAPRLTSSCWRAFCDEATRIGLASWWSSQNQIGVYG